jgi:hypothetical protein
MWPGAVSGGTDAAPGPAMAPGSERPTPPGPMQAPGPLQAHCAMTLQGLYGWLQAALPRSPQLAGVVPLVVQAVRLYRAGQHEACAVQLQSVIGIVNAGRPGMPPV